MLRLMSSVEVLEVMDKEHYTGILQYKMIMLRLMTSVEVLVVIDKEHTVHQDPGISNDNAGFK